MPIHAFDETDAIRVAPSGDDTVPPPVCGQGARLAPDTLRLVRTQCARCGGTGGQCLIELVYFEAFAGDDAQ